MQPGESDNGRLLVEVFLSDGSGAMLADGRFVMKFEDGIGRLIEPLRSLQHPMAMHRLDLRVSELLAESERAELERLRELVRGMHGGA